MPKKDKNKKMEILADWFIEKSEEKSDVVEAMSEWYMYLYIDNGKDNLVGECECSQIWLRYEYNIVNIHNNNKGVLGSLCIKKLEKAYEKCPWMENVKKIESGRRFCQQHAKDIMIIKNPEINDKSFEEIYNDKKLFDKNVDFFQTKKFKNKIYNKFKKYIGYMFMIENYKTGFPIVHDNVDIRDYFELKRCIDDVIEDYH